MATDIGTMIKRARERKRWTQRQLADALGVDRKTVDNWENGRTKPARSIGALEQVLDVSLSEQDAGEPPSVIDAEFGDHAAEFRQMMTDIYGPDAARKIRLVEEALSQPPASDVAQRRPTARPSAR